MTNAESYDTKAHLAKCPDCKMHMQPIGISEVYPTRTTLIQWHCRHMHCAGGMVTEIPWGNWEPPQGEERTEVDKP